MPNHEHRYDTERRCIICGFLQPQNESFQDKEPSLTKYPKSILKDTGERRVFETGSQRDRNNKKGRMDLLPFRALVEVSKLFEEGALKYADRNWEIGMPLSIFVDSLTRHLSQFMTGKDDEAHLTAVVWNALCLLDTVLRIQDGFYTPEIVKKLNDLPECPCINDMPTIDSIRNSKEVKEKVL